MRLHERMSFFGMEPLVVCQLFLWIYLVQLSSLTIVKATDLDCADLQIGQYVCNDPVIDSETQQAKNCSPETLLTKVPCFPVKGIYCSGQNHSGESIGFYADQTCKYTNGKKFSVALLLSVFLGWLGIDRFYLGYPALGISQLHHQRKRHYKLFTMFSGLVKFCTLGFMLLGHLLDILLIATQVVGPADGSAYVVDYYGAGLEKIVSNNHTYIKPPDY